MQKICSLLLFVLAGQTIFAGKKEKELLKREAYTQAVTGKYNLIMLRKPITKELSAHKSPHQGDIDMCAWQALRAKYEQLSREKEIVARENEELRKLLNKQEQSSSTESSPNSVVAISPTNDAVELGADEKRLLSPEEMHLKTPESKRAKSPVQFPAHPTYYYEYPTNGSIPGMCLGLNDALEPKFTGWDSIYSDCP